MAIDIERSPQTATQGRSIDDMQQLIGRVEEMLATLDEWGDGNSARLRRKLNQNVCLARDNLVYTEDRHSDKTPPVLLPALTALSIASLSGFVIGLLVASSGSDGNRAAPIARRNR